MAAYAARFEESDYEGEDVVVVKTPAGQATVLPASARRLSGDALETYADLMKRALQVAELEHEMGRLADELRGYGVSWNLIGHAVGLTGEGARGRYGDAP